MFARLASPRRVGPSATTGFAAEGVGDVAIGSLPASPDDAAEPLAAVDDRLARRAILDLRP